MGKQYDMTFQLDARLGSGYSGAFRNAQTTISQYRKEYAQTASSLRDIGGYQKQQQAVENTKSKIELLQQQYANIQKEMDETGNHSSDLKNKLLDKQAQIDKTTKAYNDQIAKMDEYKRRLEEAGADTSDLDKESERLKKELEELKKKFEDAGDEADEFGDEGESALENISSMLATSGITKALKEIYDAFAACVQVAGDFEQAMSEVEAISGANEEDIADLTERAKELGASTAFTAQQVSEGMSYMAMAGWKTTDMLDGMDAVLALAAASGEDLGTTSDIVTDALTAFGLTAKDTGRFADILAAASSNANTNVAMMGETFKYAAPVAGALGYSVEDVAVAIGLMANSGIKASQAGTTLRNIFNGFLSDVNLSSEAFGDLTVSFINSDGTMMSLSESIDTLRYYFSQMTDAERVQNAVNLAGQRGYSGLLAILNSTTEDYDKLADAINNSSGAAQRMADIKLDNMNGQLTIAKSAWEGLQIAVGEQFTPTLSKLYEISADVLGGITAFVKEHPNVVKAIAAIMATLTAFVAIIAVAKVAVIAFNAVVTTNPYLLVGAAIASLVAGVIALTSATETAKDEEEALTATTKAHAEELSELRGEYEQAKREFGENSDEARDLMRQIYELEDAYESSAQTLSEYREEVQQLHDKHEELNKKYSDATTEINNEYTSTLALIDKLEVLGSDSQMAARNQALIVPVIEELNKRYGDLGLTFDSLTGKFNMTTDEIRDVATAAYDAQKAQSDWDEYVEKSGLEKTQAEGLKKAREELDRLTASYNEAHDLAEENASGLLYWISLIGGNTSGHAFRENEKQAREAMEAQQSVVTSLNDEYAETARRLHEIEEAYGWAGDAAEADGNMFITYADAVGLTLDGVQDEVEELAASYDEAYRAAYESIDKQIGLFDSMEFEVTTSVEDMQAAFASQISYLTTYAENLRFAAEYGISDGLIAALSDGSTESAAYLQAIVTNIKDLGEGTQEAQDFVEDFNSSFAEVEEAKKTLTSTVADMKINFSSSMDEIEARMDEAIDNLDMETQAAEAAKSTMEAYAQAIREGTGDAVTAASEAANRVRQELQQYEASNNSGSSSGSISGYASGTDDASPGWHLVGENGPELMYFYGGERVFTASETRSMMRDLRDAESVKYTATPVDVTPMRSYGGVTIHFNPSYDISGTSNADEIREILEAHDAQMRDQIRVLIAEEQEDAQRREYA